MPLRRIGCSVPSVLVTRHAALGFAARAGRPPGWLLLAFVWLAFPKARAQGCLVIAGNLPVLLELADAGVTISARQCLERLQALLRRGVAAPPVRSPTQ